VSGAGFEPETLWYKGEPINILDYDKKSNLLGLVRDKNNVWTR
jgi:hypothetical protein